MEIDERNLATEIEEGTLRDRLERELVEGFRTLHAAGERLPVASHYASQIAEIIHSGLTVPLSKEAAFDLYQEVLSACERARAEVLGEEIPGLP
jgi:hypothetical protein